MDIERPELTPRQRLEETRRAIAAQMARRRGAPIRTEDAEYVEDSSTVQPGVLPSLRRGARTWWQSHPVHGVVELAQPALEDYAQRRPYKLVGIAAGIGAAFTLLKSWRVLSLTGVALALLRTSDLKGAARSLMAGRHVSSPPPRPVTATMLRTEP